MCPIDVSTSRLMVVSHVAKKNCPCDVYQKFFTRNKSVKNVLLTKTNLSTTLNTSLSIMPYHFSVPLLSSKNLVLSLQAVQRYAFPKFVFQQNFSRVLRLVFSWQPVGVFLSAYNNYLNSL